MFYPFLRSYFCCMIVNQVLYKKYNVPGPRYTSYPTVPNWTQTPTEREWMNSVKLRFTETNDNEGISLYIHLPFCESLCTYCGCNTRITKNHKVEAPYIDALLLEWSMYLKAFHKTPKIREVHFGGGTPTFFAPENLKRLMDEILASAEKHEQFEFSFEAHPANTTFEHLEVLFQLGFSRLSLGIQDFNPKVQKAINRMQTLEEVEEVMHNARAIGYKSINLDLIYGLPFQTKESISNTIKEVITLKPDRIAFYSYAHVPWLKPGQRGFTEMDLPTDGYKRSLYEIGQDKFLKAGYVEIGMDHFAFPNDELNKAMQNGKVHRNFMGYTSHKSSLLIGLGVSSISDSWDVFVQNEKTLPRYYDALEQGRLPIAKGHILSNEDLMIRKLILELMCRYEANIADYKNYDLYYAIFKSKIRPLIEDQLVEIKDDVLRVLEKGKPFLRNICMTIDAYINEEQDQSSRYSSTI